MHKGRHTNRPYYFNLIAKIPAVEFGWGIAFFTSCTLEIDYKGMATEVRSKFSPFDKIADALILAMEGGTIPWRRPWTLLTPQSIRGHKYHGANLFLLSMAPYGDPRWLTFNQCKKMGGNLTGQKSTPVTFWMFDNVNKGKDRRPPYAKVFYLFNVEQAAGIEVKPLAKPNKDTTPYEDVQAFFDAIGYEIKPEKAAFFRPSEPNCIYMPPVAYFKNMDHYYATAFHEFIHLTATRVMRDLLKLSYDKEELVAEFGAAFLCAHFGIDNTDLTDNAVSYLQGWAKKFKDDKAMIEQCARLAKKAADFLLEKGGLKEPMGADAEEEDAPAELE